MAVPAGNSADVDPLMQFEFVANQPDKPGKDNNYRGVTEYGGALYFTKGSGGNGIDTVDTVDTLPTVGNAASTPINISPGFPTDSAKATGGDITPFAVFFANATTTLQRRRICDPADLDAAGGRIEIAGGADGLPGG